MPTYEYECSKCGERFDVFQSFSDEPLKRHEGCGGKVTKVLGSVGIVLKGSGFYKTDNRSSGSKAARREAESGGKESSGSETSGKESSGKESSGSSSETGSSGGSGGSSDTGTKSETKPAKSEPKSSGPAKSA